jgi:ubiquinone biosynthesis protein
MRLLRILTILRVVLHHRLDRLLPPGLHLPFWTRLLLAPLRWLPAPAKTPAQSLRISLEELGPVFVKFGQIMSTRKDLFDNDIAAELQKLQDQVPAFDNAVALHIIETSLGQQIEVLFSSFEEAPLASASVAQVHGAVLHSGEAVVVKIIRPGIEVVIRQDLQVMYLFARLLQRFWTEAKRLHPITVVRDYERTIINELNLQLEAANATQLRKNWLGSGKLYVPIVYWDYCRIDVMVMERIHGLSSADIEGLRARGVDMQRLAHLGVEIFFTQVFEHNFFHADMHPGNVFIDASQPAEPTYIGLDCAIIGSLTENDKNYLARNLLAFFNRDYYEVARLHVESEWVPFDTDIKEFETVIRSVCEPIFQKPISEISFGRVLVSLFQTARQFNMEVQPQLVLLQKTLLNIEGMGRQLYPQLDLWQTAAPYMERWMKDRMGLRGLLRQAGDHAPDLIEHLPELPQLALAALQEVKHLSRNNRRQTQLLEDLQGTLVTNSRKQHKVRLGGVALLLAFIGTVLPTAGIAAGTELLMGTSILGGLGVYWMFIKA